MDGGAGGEDQTVRGSRAPGPEWPSAGKRGEVLVFSEKFACLDCGASMPELEPRIFSFNSPARRCPHCHGLGFQRVIDPELIVPDPTLSIAEGALDPWTKAASMLPQAPARGGRRGERDRHRRRLAATCPEGDRELLLEGTGCERHTITYRNRFGRRRTYTVALRRHAAQPRAPLREHRLREHPRAGRVADGAAAVPRLRRRPAAAGEPRGHGRRAQRLRVHAACRPAPRSSGSARSS